MSKQTISSLAFIAVGFVVIVATRVHQLISNPHLTEAQALLYYWPLSHVSIAWVIVGYLLFTKDTTHE